MKQRITAWLGSWRTARFAVDSPLNIDDAGRQLAAGLASRRTTVVYAYEHGLGVDTVIVGRLRDGRMTIRLSQPGARNSFQPVLRSRIEPTHAGCQLVCRLGWHPFTQAIVIAWFVILAVGVAISLVRTAGDLVTGHPSAVAGQAMTAGVCVAVALFLSVLASAGTWQDRDQAACLRAWVTDYLQPQS